MDFVIIIRRLKKEVNNIKRCVALLLSICQAFFMLPCASAAVKPNIQPMWTYLTGLSADLCLEEHLTVKADGTARNSVTSLYLTASLQKYSNGKWIEVAKWTQPSTSKTVSLEATYEDAEHRQSYRVVATVEAYNKGKLLETGTETANYWYP